MKKATVEARAFLKALKFANVTAAKKDARYYLNGVLFELNNKELTMVSSDGHRMSKIVVSCEFSGESNFIIEIEDVKELIKYKTSRNHPSENIEIIINGDDVSIKFNRVTREIKVIDGKFPDYKKILINRASRESTNETIKANAEYIELAGKALKIVGNGRFPVLSIKNTGKSGVIVFDCEPCMSMTDEIIGRPAIVIMPCSD